MAKKALTKTKVYLAILNHGWIRAEMAYVIIPRFGKAPGLEVVWEHPGKTWDHPISSNRNKIVKRFLETECEYLVMIDHDVVPESNPALMVYANKDIVGMPAKVRQNGRSVNWVAFMLDPEDPDGNYTPIDFSKLDTDIDLYKVDAIGTGCICIKRHVLEALKAPFHTEFDEDGICRIGTDFAFCRKAIKHGFEVYIMPWHQCEHYKEVGMKDMLSWADSDGRDEITFAKDLHIFDPQMSICQHDWRYLKSIIERVHAKTILEFGSGLSTVLMANVDFVERIVSYETNMEWGKKIAEISPDKVDIKIWDAVDIYEQLPQFDLVVVDGPMGRGIGGPGRQHSIRIAANCANHILVHDAARDEERHWQKIYLKPHFKLSGRSGHHESRFEYWAKRKDTQ